MLDRVSPQILGLAGSDLALFTGRPAADTSANGAPVMRKLVSAARRWRWVLLGSVAGGALFGLGLTLLMPSQFTSTARLEISRETSHVTNIDSVERDTSMWDQEFYQTQYGLLRTQVLAERVARDLGVVDDPAFFRMFGRKDLFKTDHPADEAQRNTVAGQLLLKHVDIAPVRGSSLVDIRAVTPNPALSQRIAATWAQDYIASNLERRFDASSYARHFLETRLEQLREKLEESEKQAVDYAAQQGIIDLPSSGDANAAAGGSTTNGRSLVSDDLGALNAALETATVERIQAQSQLNEARQPGASSLALGNEAIAGLRQKRADAEADYSKMMIQFQPDYPQAKALASQVKALDAAIADEENRVRASLEGTYVSARTREAALYARVEGLKSGLTDLRQRDIQYNIYQRDADTNRELYDALLQRYKEIGVAGAVENNNVAVVDAPKAPDRRSSPRLLVNLLLAMAAGGLIGIASSASLQQIDEGVLEPSELEDKLGLTVLGVAPRMRSADPLVALQDPRSKLVEAYLALQANLELSTAQGAPSSLAVISTRPREGKSTTTIALARSLARSGRKVVLVDADLRSPSIHSAFGMANEAGVSNYLTGAQDLDAILRPTEQNGLLVMTAGPQPPNAADLLMGKRLPLLIEQLGKRFDHVIVDSPPVIGLADAALVGSAVEAVIYVVESRSAPASMVRSALNRLRTANVHVLGAVLTKFDAKRTNLGYGHGYDYGYGYGFNYGR